MDERLEETDIWQNIVVGIKKKNKYLINENIFQGDPNFDGPYSYSWHNNPVRSSSFISDTVNIFNFITYSQSAEGTDVIFNLRFLDTFESASSYDHFFSHGLENISNINELSSSFLFNLPDPDDTSNLIFDVMEQGFVSWNF